MWAAVLSLWACCVVVGARQLTPALLDRPHRIVGGEPVKRGQLPWQVSIQKQGHHFCGGTLIAPTIVVTAAHCTKTNYTGVRVVTGAWDLREAHRTYEVAKVMVHDYDHRTFKGDIAILKLGSRLDAALTRDLPEGTPVALETRADFHPGQKCTISGWGRTSVGSSLPDILRAADVEPRMDEECRKLFAAHRSYHILDTNLCAGGENQDACQGDSGGPLVCCRNGTDDVSSCSLAGVTSWGIGCATPGLPGVYTEVAHYLGWIRKTVGRELGMEEVDSLRFLPPTGSFSSSSSSPTSSS